MAALLDHVNGEFLTTFGIGSATEYVDKVRVSVNRNIGGSLFTTSMLHRNAALEKNPLKYRYGDYANTLLSNIVIDNVGEAAVVPDGYTKKENFLDGENGLVGFTLKMDNDFIAKNTRYNDTKPSGWESNNFEFYTTNKSIFKTRWSKSHGDEDSSISISSDRLRFTADIFGSTMAAILGEIADSNNAEFSFGNDGGTKVNSRYGFYQENNIVIGNVAGSEFIDDETQFQVEKDKELENKSILHVTNKLFREKRMGTLISRFSSNDNADTSLKVTKPSLTQTAVTSKFGLSHGRNLLTKKAFESGSADYVNNYQNPYCRVWTHHHQYSKFINSIRPFSENGESATSIKDLQKDLGDGYRPNKGNQFLNDNSVLDYRTNRPRFAPTINQENGDSVDIKRCMFSIENLAWKNSGEKYSGKLGKNSIGPNGGRIMWFPPYGLSFGESTNPHWESTNFIGRGEPIYTYSNTERTGNLSFILLVDHPSIVDAYMDSNNLKNVDGTDKEKREQELLRFFAGCDNLEMGKSRFKIKKEDENYVIRKPNTPDPNPPAIPDVKIIVFYPNCYSGFDEIKYEYKDGTVISEGAPGTYEEIQKRYKTFLPGILKDESVSYELAPLGWRCDDDTGATKECKDVCLRQKQPNAWNKENFKIFDAKFTGTKTPSEKKHIWDADLRSFGLNTKEFTNKLNEKLNNITPSEVTNDGVDDETVTKAIEKLSLTGSTAMYISIMDLLENATMDKKAFLNKIANMNNKTGKEISVDPNDYKISCECVGYASQHGSQDFNSKTSKDNNEQLPADRAMSLQWLMASFPFMSDVDKNGAKVVTNITSNGKGLISVENEESRSALIPKIGRVAIATIKITATEAALEPETTYDEVRTGTTTRYTKEAVLLNEEKDSNAAYGEDSEYKGSISDEYVYFKDLEEKDKLAYDKIVDKVKYFNPAFHSITPEGFNARLTFLQQCTRPGPTLGASDDYNSSEKTMGAGNLAFGRPPFCILRIGDFYYSKVCIENVNIHYEVDNGIQWDLNPEGIGVQPMYAKVDMNIKFLGGSDLDGPVERIQNAVSANYYANTSVYSKYSLRNESYEQESQKSLESQYTELAAENAKAKELEDAKKISENNDKNDAITASEQAATESETKKRNKKDKSGKGNK